MADSSSRRVWLRLSCLGKMLYVFIVYTLLFYFFDHCKRRLVDVKSVRNAREGMRIQEQCKNLHIEFSERRPARSWAATTGSDEE